MLLIFNHNEKQHTLILIHMSTRKRLINYYSIRRLFLLVFVTHFDAFACNFRCWSQYALDLSAGLLLLLGSVCCYCFYCYTAAAAVLLECGVFFSFFCYSLSLPSSSGSVIITMLQYFCYFFLFLLFTSFIGKFTSFDFVHIKFSSYVLDLISVSTKYLSIQTHIATIILFGNRFVCFLSGSISNNSWNERNCNEQKHHNLCTLYLLYLSIQYVCIIVNLQIHLFRLPVYVLFFKSLFGMKIFRTRK